MIPCSSAVAMFMCVSRVCFLAVNSGRAVMAAFKLAAFEERSLWSDVESAAVNECRSVLAHICDRSLMSPTPVVRVMSLVSVLYLLKVGKNQRDASAV